MHANKAVVALIASLAAAATLLPAGSALAAGTDTKGPAARGNTVVNTGRATLSTRNSQYLWIGVSHAAWWTPPC